MSKLACLEGWDGDGAEDGRGAGDGGCSPGRRRWYRLSLWKVRVREDGRRMIVEVESRARESLGGQATGGGGGVVGLGVVVGRLEWGWWVGMLGGRLWAL